MIGTFLVILAALIIAVVGCVAVAPAIRWPSTTRAQQDLKHNMNK